MEKARGTREDGIRYSKKKKKTWEKVKLVREKANVITERERKGRTKMGKRKLEQNAGTGEEQRV